MGKMYVTTSARLHPTQHQRDVLFTILNAGKLVYNRIRAEVFSVYRADKTPISLYSGEYEDKAIELIKTNPFASVISEYSARNVARDVVTSISKHPQLYYTGITVQKFKPKTRNSSMRILVENVVVYSDCVEIPDVGKVRCNMESHGAFDRGLLKEGMKTRAWLSVGKHAVLSLAITRSARSPKKVSVESSDRIIGLDYGLRKLATLSTGEVLELPQKVHLLEKRLQFYQSKRDSAMPKSNSKKRWDVKYKDTYIKWRNAINGYCQSVANRLFRDYDVVVVEPLSVNEKIFHNRDRNHKCEITTKHGMLGYHAHNYNMLNSGLPELYKWLRITAFQRGKRLVCTYKTYPSTQLCSVCGERNMELRSTDIREWTCPNCGTVHDRDVNAARNMRAFGIKFIESLKNTNGLTSSIVDGSIDMPSKMVESHLSSVNSTEHIEPILSDTESTNVTEEITNSENAPSVCNTQDSPVYIAKTESDNTDVSENDVEVSDGLQNCGLMTPLSVKADEVHYLLGTDDSHTRTQPDCDEESSPSHNEVVTSDIRSRIHTMLQNARNNRRRTSASCDGDTPNQISGEVWANRHGYW